MVQNQKNCGKQAQAKGLFDRLLGGGWQSPFDCRSDTSKVTPLPQGVIDTIQEKLEVEHITKEAALALRESLCSTFEKGIQGFEKCAATLPKTLGRKG